MQPLRATGDEIVVVDGGSADATVTLARSLADRVISSARGRAIQMNAGARATGHPLLLFLHADTRIQPAAVEAARQSLARTGRRWGRFDVAIEGRSPWLALIAWAMNQRSRLTGIATGDQAIFVARDLFERVGGFPEQPLMEDIALTSALRRIERPLCLRDKVVTSGRRWERHGVVRTVVGMWRLRWAYWRGTDPHVLATRYPHHGEDVSR